ncbi:taperin [Ochotona curzoniae]|uniref:taperin n=1 Tax=Ochotona curzoniae TaxID=130825 RepID=UPI001B3530A9|nr:taperin [Ochotona curzoniae]
MAGLGRAPAPRGVMPAWKREILERRRAKLAALGAAPAAERPVLAESLGPLRENPFLRLESARAAPPLLDLYRRVPGVRAIRADNILIIESAPGSPPAGPPAPAGTARIRAAEVLVYEEVPPAGRVSRLLEKFDPPAATRPRGSPERTRAPAPATPRAPPTAPRAPPTAPRAPPPPAAPRAPPPPAAPRLSERPGRSPPAARPGDGPGPGLRRSEFLQKTGSNSFTVHPRGLHRATAPEPRPAEWKPKAGTPAPPASPGTPSATATAPSPASATPSQRQWVASATSANDSFEILPAPAPDWNAVPPGDLQARALASLRANSRNSFVFVPKRKAPAAAPPQEPPRAERPQREVGCASPGHRESGAQQAALGRIPSAPEEEEEEEGGGPRPGVTLTDGGGDGRSGRWPRPSSPPAAVVAEPAEGHLAPGPAKNGQESGLPVTFIDDVDSEEDEEPQDTRLPCPGLPRPSAELRHRGTNTFVVVPKRKPGVQQEPTPGEPRPFGPDGARQDEAGGLLKKRYPTVHEIEVIGGYLALQKSCLTKAGSSRKKMKISFNDQSLQTTFEYPSESSLAQDEEEEDEEEREDEEEDDEAGSGLEEKPFALFLPRATLVSSVVPESPRLPDGGSGLSSYTPKHCVAFSKWQEQMLEPVAVREAEPPPQEVTLTPASPDDLSDFRSEPALYF